MFEQKRYLVMHILAADKVVVIQYQDHVILQRAKVVYETG